MTDPRITGPDPLPRFCAYAVLRNLRVFDPFLVLFLTTDLGLDFTAVGLVVALEKTVTAVLEVPLAVVADRWGRRRTLVASFLLAAAAMLGLAVASTVAQPLIPALVAVAVYGVSEAMRTGTHKAIILDWLSRRGERGRKVAVIGRARFWSKSAAGAGALAGGLLVWLTGGYTALFAFAALPTLAGAALVARYPRALDDSGPGRPALATGPARRGARWRQAIGRPGLPAAPGESHRREPNEASWPARRDAEGVLEARREGATPPDATHGSAQQVYLPRGLLALLVPSVLFESQLKLAAIWLQPALADGIEDFDLVVAGGIGAMAYGIWHLLAGLLAGGAALLSTRLVARAGSVARALTLAHGVAALALLAASAGILLGASAGGLIVLLGLGAIQNARRPIFVAALDDVASPRWRATTLSVESQARALLHAVGAVGLGWIADTAGLGVAFAIIAGGVTVAAGLSMVAPPAST